MSDQQLLPSPQRELDVRGLRSWGENVAFVAHGHEMSYAELADRVEQRRVEIEAGDNGVRRLVTLHGANNVEFVVTLIAALTGKHPLIVVDGPEKVGAIEATYRPDVVVACESGRAVIAHAADRRTRHALHRDLALLLATSGSTGAGKLVRLSRQAVASNAASIATYLQLSEQDRAITSLPLHYCYGLSVLTSHLAVGASVVLTKASVVDRCFWDDVERWGVTGFAGVPFTFEMIERMGIDVMRVPSLRYATQAGGRMAPEAVTRYAQLGRECGWDFFVMYGQTEATARMAYLPPNAALEHPGAVGIPIPGGTIEIDHSVVSDAAPSDSSSCASMVGEVVYRGPNVMMGYARGAADLAAGHLHTELRTGDLGRFDSDGHLEIVGRLSRFLKLHGKRIDLDQLEADLERPGRILACVGDDDGLVVAVETQASVARLDEQLRCETLDRLAIPERHVVALTMPSLPRTSSGKVDAPALVIAARALAVAADEASDRNIGAHSVTSTFESIFGLGKVEPQATFVGLGGDSLSYVEMSTRLEQLLGELPMEWHVTTVAELERRSTIRTGTGTTPRLTRQVETSVVIRAVGISLIVCTHMRLFRVAGGAHTLLAVLGYNFARFQLLASDTPHRLRRAVATIGRVAVPTSVWIGLNMLLFGGYSVGALLLANNYTGDAARQDGRWEYWYFETFVQTMIVLALVFAIPAIRRTERRAPFAFALGVLALTFVFRFDLVQWGGTYNEMFRTHTIASFVAIGWCAQRATSISQRVVVTLLAVVTAVGFFDQTDREWRIIIMVAALIWIPRFTLPTPLAVVVGKVASASMHIFLVHWQVFPLLTRFLDRRAAYVATMAVGVAVWWMCERGVAVVKRTVDERRRRHQLAAGSESERVSATWDATPATT